MVANSPATNEMMPFDLINEKPYITPAAPEMAGPRLDVRNDGSGETG